MLELDDIQSGVLRPRPTPYAATYILLRIDDRKAGRELMRRLERGRGLGRPPDEPGRPTPGSASRSPTTGSRRWACRRTRSTASPGSSGRGWPRARRRWATPARAAPSTGRSRSGRRTSTSCSPRSRRIREQLEGGARARPQGATGSCPGIEAIWRQDCHALPTEREPFGFRDGISHPAIEGSGIPGTNPREQPLKAGEFVLGYPDEMGGFRRCRSPRSWAATAPTSSSASCTSAWRRSAGT